MRAHNPAGKTFPPGEERFFARPHDGHGENGAHRGPDRLEGKRVGAVAHEDDTLCAHCVHGAQNGAQIAGIADPVERHPDLAGGGFYGFKPHCLLLENTDNHLRIVTFGDGRQHLFADDENKTAGCDGARGQPLHRLIAAPRFGIEKRADRPAGIERVDHQLLSLGNEGVFAVAILLLRQRANVLDDRIGEAGDFLHLTRPAPLVVMSAHDATQRENSEVDRARPADFSRMISSPDSTRPPSPANVSRIRAWMAKKDARME